MAFDFTKLSLLVVEDVKTMRSLLVNIFESMDVGRVIEADNGEDGFELFCKENPDIVILDWAMEPMDGLETLQKIRKDSQSPNRVVPVIMLTGYSAVKRVIQARDLGATEFLVKPFTANDIAKRLAYVINKPRDYIDAPGYFGPDRRRIKKADFNGPYKRKEDREGGMEVGFN